MCNLGVMLLQKKLDASHSLGLAVTFFMIKNSQGLTLWPHNLSMLYQMAFSYPVK